MPRQTQATSPPAPLHNLSFLLLPQRARRPKWKEKETQAAKSVPARLPLIRPPCKPSRRASGHLNLHSPNTSHLTARTSPPSANGAHVRPRSRSPNNLQLPHRQTPRASHSSLPPVERPRHRTRVVHRHAGQRSRHGLHRGRGD